MSAEMSARPALAIYLFGRPEVLREDQRLPPLATQKTQSLLAYLIIHSNRPHLRDELAELFWGDRDEGHARHSLTTALWRIRRLLGKDYLLADSTTVRFNPDRPFWLDVTEFEKRVKEQTGSPADLAAAVDLYRGDLLEGFYDDWCIEERYYLESLYLDALKRLVDWHEAQGHSEEVLVYSQKYLAHDPLMQTMHLARMRALLAKGDRNGARHQWQVCCDTRQQELHAPPSPEALKQAESLLGADFIVPLSLQPLPSKAPPHWDLLERPPFVGRGPEMSALQSLWEQTSHGRGHMILISGEAGVGKTRLTEEFEAMVRWHGGMVTRGRCYESERTLPYQMLTEILRDLARQEHIGLRDLSGWAQNELARLVPEQYPAKVQSVSSPASMQPDQQAILFHAMAELIRQFTSHAPLLVVLEDIHWAAETTLAAIHYLVRKTSDVRVLYLATFRPQGSIQSRSLNAMAAQLARDGLAQHLILERLSLDAIAELVRRTMQADEGTVSRLYEHTQGNAFFTVETLRALSGVPTSEDRLPLPDTVRDLIQSRLDQLSPAAREWIACAAVAGRAFDFEPVRRACGLEEDTALEATDELLHQGLVCEGSGISGNDYEFVHHLVHEATYTAIHHRRRQRLHRSIGEAMESLYGDRTSISGTLAHHFDVGGELGKALHYHNLAAQRATAMFAWQEAEDHLNRMLWLIEQPDGQVDMGEHCRRRAQILIRRAELRSLLGCLTERDADLEALSALAETSHDDYLRLQTCLQRARYLNLDARYEQAVLAAQQGLMLADRLEDKSAYGYLLTQIGFAHYFLGKPRPALTALDSALRMTEETDEETRRHILHILGYVHFHLGNYACALAYQQKSYTVHQTTGDVNGVLWAGLDMAATLQHIGRNSEAEEYLTQHLKLAQRIGARSAEVYGLIQSGSWNLSQGNYLIAKETLLQALASQTGLRTEHARAAAEVGIGLALFQLGDGTESQRWLEQAVTRARPIQHRRRLVEALIGLGLATCEAGQYSAAYRYLSKAVGIARESECRRNLAAGLAALARVERKRGNLQTALEHASEAVWIAEGIGVPVIKMWGKMESGLTMLEQGDFPAALQHTQTAVDLIPHCDESWIGSEQAYRSHSRVLRALGCLEAAEEADRWAEAVIAAKANRIPDPRQRQQYYEFASRDP